MNAPSKIIRRISFLGKKKKRDSKTNSEHEEVKEKKQIPLLPEFSEIFVNTQNKEKIILFKNNLHFTITGSGILRIIHGDVDIFGYTIPSNDDCNDYSFDICENSPMFSCINKGSLIKSDNEYEEVMTKLNKFISLKNNKDFLHNNLNTIKNFLFSIGKDKISIVYFKEISENFKIIKLDKFADHSESKNDIIDYSKYEDYLTSDDENIFLNNKNFLICGKKNSGKSTFLQFLLNKLSYHIKNVSLRNTNQEDNNLFLIDLDSAQPLVSSPFTVSLIKINKPLNCNFITDKYKDDWYEIVASIFVEDNTPSNKFEEYLSAVKTLKEIFDKLGRNNFLVVNTNGYTHGLGNVVNSSVVEVMKPDVNFYVKNLNSGRLEKGKEFEDFVINEQIENSLSIVMRQFRLAKSTISHKTNLEIKTIVVENSFKLKELKNLEKKNHSKSLYLMENLTAMGSESGKRFKTIMDAINMKHIAMRYLIEVPFENIFFSFNFNNFLPSSELDVFLSINAKSCTVLKYCSTGKYNNTKSNLKQSSLKMINFELIPVEERKFECFSYIYNIDILNRKLIIFSEKLKNSFKKNPERKIILYRNNSLIDKALTSSIEKENVLESKISSMRFPSIILGVDNKKNPVTIPNEFSFLSLYSTRNKYSII